MNRLILALLVLVVVASCSSSVPSRENRAPAVVVGGDVLATVDGVAITRADVEAASAVPPDGHGGGTAPTPEVVLESLIEKQLLAQRALAGHLESDAEYAQELARREAQLNAWKRDRLAELFEQQQANQRPEVSEADARHYYDANASRIRTEVRVSQILLRDEARIRQALVDLRAGATFDEVAIRQFPVVPDLANKPWELPPLRWTQIPEPWQPVIDGIAVGQFSDVIVGANHRFWIIKVLERRENPELTFEATRPVIATLLQNERSTTTRSRLLEEARRSAHIVYAHPPTAPAAPAPAPAPGP